VPANVSGLLTILQKVDACRDDFEALANGSDHKLVTLEVASGSSVHLGLPETFAGTQALDLSAGIDFLKDCQEAIPQRRLLWKN
jgi:hypothetical protein